MPKHCGPSGKFGVAGCNGTNAEERQTAVEIPFERAANSSVERDQGVRIGLLNGKPPAQRRIYWLAGILVCLAYAAFWTWNAIGLDGAPQLADLPQVRAVVWERDGILQSSLEGDELRFDGVMWKPAKSEIRDVQAGGNVLAVLTVDKSNAAMVELLDRTGREPEVRYSLRGATAIDLSRDGEYLAYVACGYGGCHLSVQHLETGDEEIVVPRGVAPGKAVSWQPDGRAIAYTTTDNNVAVISLSDRRIRALAEGISPSYSPDGLLIALVRGDNIILVDAYSGVEIHTEHQALSARCDETTKTIIGPLCVFHDWVLLDTRLYWSPDGTYLLFSDEDMKQYDLMKCWLMDTRTGAVSKISEAWGWCGPWLAEKARSRKAPKR